MIYFHHPAPHTAFDKAIIAASHRPERKSKGHTEPANPYRLSEAQGIANAIKLTLPFWFLVLAGAAWLLWGPR